MTPKPRLQQLLRPHVWNLVLRRAPSQSGGVTSRSYHGVRSQELEKANALRYPRIQHQDATPPMRIPVFRENFQHVKEGEAVEGEEVVVHGRLQSIRRAGSKLAFLVLRSEFEDLQGMCNVRLLEAAGVDCSGFKSLVQLLNKGDIISLKGKATRTSTGELTILATGLPELLTPSLVPLPFQVLDQTLRFHNRHIDLLTNRKSIDTLRLRSHLIKYIRDFLHERGFLEFQTPILAENAGGAVARPFVTGHEGGQALAMRIAPELWLKRLVVGGVDKVFELGPSFRNEGIDQTHNPEFTSCEFYSAYASIDDLIRLTEDLICGAASHCQSLISTKLDSLPPIDISTKFPPNPNTDGGTSNTRFRFKQMEFIPSLEAALSFTLPDLESANALETLISLLQTHNHPVNGHLPTLTLPKLLDDLASRHIEPHSLTSPIFITHHPVCMSPLSKSFICPKTSQHVSARTELFIDGMEIANMYEEENSPFAQREKFIHQATRHRDPSVRHELPVPPPTIEGEIREDDILIDESYVHALESGLPPTGGWGCGVERLVMLFAGTRRISDCLSFGNVRNVVAVSRLGKVTADRHHDHDHDHQHQLEHNGDEKKVPTEEK